MNRIFSTGKIIFSVLLLATIPVSIIFTGLDLRSTNQEFSLFAIDPEYSYLYSGVLLGQGSINLFIDHPGTPLIVLAALVTRTVHLFRPSSSYAEDVLQHPDFYLNLLNISMIVLIGCVTFITGWWVYRKTRNLPATVFIQFSPFVVEYVFSVVERYMPEPWFIALVVFLCGATVLDIYGKLDHGRMKYKRPLLFGMIIGFGISLKFSFSPFLIAPFFLFEGVKKKLSYLVATIASFLVFTFPLLKRGKVFYEWIKAIVMHSGKHGSGKDSVIDPEQFLVHLKAIVQSEKHLVYAAVLAAFFLTISMLPYIQKRIGNKRYILALAGFLAALVAGMLAISKHFETYYLIPYSMLTVFLCYLSVNILLEIIQYRKIWVETIIYSLFAVGLLLNPRSMRQHEVNMELRKQYQSHKRNIILEVDKLPEADALIISADNWNIRKESGLMFGMLMTPIGSHKFGKQLNAIYPHTYLFKEWNGQFVNWFDQPYTAMNLLEQYSNMMAIIKHYSRSTYDQLETVFSASGKADIEVIYSDPLSGLQVYRINRIPALE